MLPRRSSRVCCFTADWVDLNKAKGNTYRHRSMVVGSSAYTVFVSSSPKSSWAKSLRAWAISRWANSA
jgi:hypothetical protein